MSHHGLFAHELFPAHASYCYVITEKSPPQPSLENYLDLHPLEQALVSHAVAKRKAEFGDRKSTRLNSSHGEQSRMPSSA